MKKVAFYTLGCKVNQNETQAITGLFRQKGYTIVDFNEKADVYVINSCTVTHLADRKSRQAIRRAINNNPGAVVAVSGCYAQVAPDEILKIPGVKVVVGTQDRARIVDLVEEATGRVEPICVVRDISQVRVFEEIPISWGDGRTRAFVKIQEGCNQFCSYCIIPYARGPLRSRHPERVVEEIRHLVEEGCRELVLTGIHVSAYGRDLIPKIDLMNLLELILKRVNGEYRLRLSSVEPKEISPGLLELIQVSSRLCRHLHIPLQSGDDEILKLMNRHYTTGFYRELVERAVKVIPGIAITSDVMVGFPGETDQQFENTYNFIENLEFSDLHVFKYSSRQGSKAAGFKNQVPSRVKETRSQRLRVLARKKKRQFMQRFIDDYLWVLPETRNSSGYWEGFSDNYLRVYFKGEEEVKNHLIKVGINGLTGDGAGVFGEPV